MAPTALVKKTGPKPKPKPAEKKKYLPPPKPVDASSQGDEEDWEDEDGGDGSETDEEDDGIDEVGFEKLIKALGDHPLNEYDQAHLVALAGDEEDDDSEGGEGVEDEELGGVSGPDEENEEIAEEAEGGGSGSGSDGAAEAGESSGDEDVLALDELEDVELHPDAVPRRGVRVVDNKVRATQASQFSYLIFSRRMHSSGSGKPSNSTPNYPGQKPSPFHTQRLTPLTTRMT